MTLTKLILGLFACFALGIPIAAAEPPAGSDCVAGYNPDALTNVCTKPTNPQTIFVPVGTSGEICIVGDVCAPMPVYNPEGGAPVIVPSVPLVDYIEVAGVPIPPSPPSLNDPQPLVLGVFRCLEPDSENLNHLIDDPLNYLIDDMPNDAIDCNRNVVSNWGGP